MHALWQKIRNYWTGAKMFGEGEIDTALDQAVTKKGYLELRREQELAVKKFAMGNDVFVSLPTGSGKSVCFSILPIVFDLLRGKPGSVVVVVSPLISLMKDQVVSMKKGESMLYIMEKLAQIHYCLKYCIQPIPDFIPQSRITTEK